jgi:hypothetical protein
LGWHGGWQGQQKQNQEQPHCQTSAFRCGSRFQVKCSPKRGLCIHAVQYLYGFCTEARPRECGRGVRQR